MARYQYQWQSYHWPEWVPQKIRDEVESFYAPELGRGPRAWEKSAERNHAPALGERVRLRGFRRGPDGFDWVEGRYVHAWNNIGRVVRDDGSYACVDVIYYKPPSDSA